MIVGLYTKAAPEPTQQLPRLLPDRVGEAVTVPIINPRTLTRGSHKWLSLTLECALSTIYPLKFRSI